MLSSSPPTAEPTNRSKSQQQRPDFFRRPQLKPCLRVNRPSPVI
ncbi:regulatory-associated protein of TOR 2 isoform X1 [Iris pallida]|uniref:Regulatory-associated protein of TOR 2 isoform X1 n=1 Tax=Iris pallida TaxID=29817 RepID=A0AAX6I6Z6_IRIPA|nr:regulatory-associated protein of TOR 2 isoform X1 [Iris pallida]